jgi:hypothetical protein
LNNREEQPPPESDDEMSVLHMQELSDHQFEHPGDLLDETHRLDPYDDETNWAYHSDRSDDDPHDDLDDRPLDIHSVSSQEEENVDALMSDAFDDDEFPYFDINDLPKASIENIKLSQDMINNIKNATLEDDIRNDDNLRNLRHPPHGAPTVDPITRLSIDIFLALSNGSQQMYKAVRLALARHDPNLLIHSYTVVKKKVETITLVTKIETDMCVNSCLAFTGPFSALQECPKCHENRYEDGHPALRNQKARKCFYTIPIGPQLQALWRSPEGADRMRYRERKTREIIQELERNDGQVSAYEDVFSGREYLQAVDRGDIGAQLYRDKASDCWFFIWVILNLSPDLRYKKHSIIPAGFVPGPKAPVNTESFLLPSFRHFSALQKEGLKVWDGRMQQEVTSRPFFMFGTADTLGLPIISGLVGHSGSHGCRLYCGFRGRRKIGGSMYYAAALKPENYNVAKSSHPDIDVEDVAEPNPCKYFQNLSLLLSTTTKRAYEDARLETGIVRPSICLGFQPNFMFPVPYCFPLDLMHLASLNVPQHLLAIWRNTIKPQLPGNSLFIGLSKADVWQAHGTLVASAKPHLPGSFNRPPRNPAEKINSGFKAWEYLLYFWVLGPAVFRVVLPHEFWTHFCKLVIGIRILHQRRITPAQLQIANKMIIEWEKEFEIKYYQRCADFLHLMRPCAHAILHAAQETIRCGPLNLVAQWALENTVGNLGREVHQPSNPFANLAQRGLLRANANALKSIIPELYRGVHIPGKAISLGNNFFLLRARDRHYRTLPEPENCALRTYLECCGQTISNGSDLKVRKWARLSLPNGQKARCRWKEQGNEQKENFRCSRHIKVMFLFLLTVPDT